MNQSRVVNIIISIFLLVSFVIAQEVVDEQGVGLKKSGQTTMNFLEVNVIPRAVGMGDAYTAVGEGISSVFYNPAGLSEINNRFEILVTTTQWIADINYYVAGVGWNLGNVGTLGLSLLSVDYGDIIGTRLLSVEESETDNVGYLETGPVDNVGAYSIGLTYARNISHAFSMGVALNYANQQLGQSIVYGGQKDNAQGKIFFNLGAKYYTPIKSLRLGMSMRNFSTQVKYEEISAYLPMTFAVGAAMDLMSVLMRSDENNNSLLASVEFTHPNNYTERLRLGLEFNWSGILALQVGYNTNHDISSLAFGFGISGEIMNTRASVSYSYSRMDIFDDVNRLGLTFAF
jgi:hypothetical protein